MTDPHTLVVNLKDHRDWRPDHLPEDVVYVGRPMYRGGWHLPGSPFASPYKPGPDGTREEVVVLYRRWLAGQVGLQDRLPDLRGRRLACWCAPQPCHARVLAELANARPS